MMPLIPLSAAIIVIGECFAVKYKQLKWCFSLVPWKIKIPIPQQKFLSLIYFSMNQTSFLSTFAHAMSRLAPSTLMQWGSEPRPGYPPPTPWRFDFRRARLMAIINAAKELSLFAVVAALFAYALLFGIAVGLNFQSPSWWRFRVRRDDSNARLSLLDAV